MSNFSKADLSLDNNQLVQKTFGCSSASTLTLPEAKNGGD